MKTETEEMTSSIVLKKKNRRLSLLLLSYSCPIAILTCFAYLACRTALAWTTRGGPVVWLVLLVEGLVSIPRLFTQLSISLTARNGDGDRLPQTIRDGDWPMVDVFVTYCGEPMETILNTLKAACNLDYPQEILRIIVLDDSDSAKLEQAVGYLRKEHPNLWYVARKVQVTTHSKAANLNFGLHFVDTFKKVRAEYIAVLDVDMIPEPDWLRHVVPHVFNNPQAGLACPIQRFYNLPEDSLDIKADINPIELCMLLQDFSNDAWCTGSGFVARRSALDDIGGFPEVLLQEDILTSNHLSGAGWQTIHVPDTVQWGLGPETVSDCLRQCQRWKVGFLSISLYNMTKEASNLPAKARLNVALWGIVISSGSFIWTFALAALPLLVLTRRPVVSTNTLGQLRMITRLATLDFAAQSLYYILLSSLLKFRLPIGSHLAALWTQPWRAWITLRYFVIPKLTGKATPNFTPTGIKMNGDAEHAASNGGSYIASFRAIFWDSGAGIHLLIFVCCVAGADAWMRAALVTYGDNGARNAAQLLLTGIAWPHTLWLWFDLAKAAWVPMAYALKTVRRPTKNDLLTRCGSHGAKYATKEARDDYLRRPSSWLFAFKCCFYLAVNFMV